MKKTLLLILIVIGAIIFFGINRIDNQKGTNDNKLQVVTSIYPLYYFATQIGREKIDVYNIVPSGAEPHEYEPTAQDIARIETSDVIIVNGVKLEPWANRIKTDLQGKKTLLITVGDGLANLKLNEDNKNIIDPHIWLAPPLASIEIEKITQTLIQTDKTNAEYYRTNATQLISQMDDLNTAYINGLAQCGKKDIITSHAAFGYMAHTYGLRQVSIAGLSTEEEPSIKQLSQIADFAKKNSIKYIFFEELVSPKLSQTLAAEVGAQTLVLNPIEGISKEDMKAGKNYFTIMQDNLTNLRTALECK